MGKFIFLSFLILSLEVSASCTNRVYEKLGWMSVFGRSTETETFRFIPNFGEIDEILIASDDSFSFFDIRSVKVKMSSGSDDDLRFFNETSLKSYKTVYKDEIWGAGPFKRVDEVIVTMRNDDMMSRTFDIYSSHCDD